MNLYRQKLTGWDSFVDEATSGVFPYLAADTNPDINTWDDVTSIENWHNYGMRALPAFNVQREIKALLTTFASHTTAEKEVFAKWFLVDKSDRDTVRSADEQEYDAAIFVANMCRKSQLMVMQDVAGSIKDSDVEEVCKLISIVSPSWQPPTVSISAFLTNGALSFLNSGAGYHRSFPENTSSSIVTTLPLKANGIPYDGSDLKIEFSWSLYSLTPSASNNVIFNVKYAFVKADGTENAYTILDGTVNDTFVVDSKSANTVYIDSFSAITGKDGATHLQLTIERDGNSDTYAQNVDFHNIKLLKA